MTVCPKCGSQLLRWSKEEWECGSRIWYFDGRFMQHPDCKLNEARQAAREIAEYRSVPDDVRANWVRRFPWLERE